MTAKILVLDIETFPNIAYVWKFWKENVGAKQVLHHSQIASFACKWLNEPEVFYFDRFHLETEKALLELLNEFLDHADIVVAHNGDRFDLPTIAGRSIVLGLQPPSPFKTIDTRLSSRKLFNFPSNSLEYLGNVFDVEKKDNHKKFPGFELWAECLKGNAEAWDEMKVYNIQDVITLEQVYLKMRPYINNHPHVTIFDEPKETDAITCPKCGGIHTNRRGFSYTNTGKYQRFTCLDCGGWARTRYTELNRNVKLLRNA